MPEGMEENYPEKVKYAFDVVKDIRKERREKEMEEISKRDKDGSLMSLYQLWSLIPDIDTISINELIELLCQRILFNDADILCLNKPYGLSAQEGPKMARSLSAVLPKLLRSVFPSNEKERKLYLCQRLDKETTGAMLIATNWERKEEVASLMSDGKVVKKYLCITKGIPKPDEGTIRIPLGQRIVGGRYKRIAGEMLALLGMRSPKSRNLPMYLHASENPDKFPLCLKWNFRVEALIRRSIELDKLMCWLSTLGGGFSALGDYHYSFAEKAGQISTEQLRLALLLGDPVLISRCKLFIALSLMQRGRLRPARHIVKAQYLFATGINHQTLLNCCHGIWEKLRYLYKTKTKNQSFTQII